MPEPHQRSDSPLVGVVTILLTLAGWTVVPLLIKMFVADVDAWTSNGWRYGFAALLWLPLLVFKWRRGTLRRGLMIAALIPGAINAAAQVAFTLSFYSIDPGLVTFGLRMQIIAVTIGAAIMFPAERLVIRTPLFILALLLVLGGTLATVGQSPGFGSDAGRWGVTLAMLAGVGFAGYALAVRRCMVGYGSMESFAAISQYTAIAMVVLMLILGDRSGATALDMTPSRFGLFLLSAVIGIAASHVLYYMSIARLGVAVSTGVIQIQPFTVGVLSVLLMGEVLTAGQWLSGAVAVTGAIGMLIVQHRVTQRLKRTRPEKHVELPADMVVAASAAEEDQPGGHAPASGSADVAPLEQQRRQ